MTYETDGRKDGETDRERQGVATFQDLIAWQKARSLVREVYLVSKSWPSEERFGLTNQVRRSVVSIASNIAEGNGRTGSREFFHHLSIAHGSLREVHAQLILAGDLEFASTDDVNRLFLLTEEVGRLVRGLIKALERRTAVHDEGILYDADEPMSLPWPSPHPQISKVVLALCPSFRLPVCPSTPRRPLNARPRRPRRPRHRGWLRDRPRHRAAVRP